MYENGLKATNLKEEFQRRGEELKKAVDSVVVELSKNVDEELKQHQPEADNIMMKLVQLEATLKAEINVLNEQLLYNNNNKLIQNKRYKNYSVYTNVY